MKASHEDGIIEAQSIRETIRELILELAPEQSVATLNADHSLVDDLRYHSLALLELAFTLEDEFGLDPMDEEATQRIVTVSDIEGHVINELQRKHDDRVSAGEQQ